MRFKIRLFTTFVLTLFLFLFFQESVIAANFKVTGTITDNKNDPVAHVTISVTDETTLKVVTTTTADQNGYYTLFVPKGTYDITANPPPGSNLRPEVNSHIKVASDISIHNNLNNVVSEVNTPQSKQRVSVNNWTGWILLSTLILIIIVAVGFALIKNKKQK